MATYKPYIKQSDGSISEMPLDASTLGGIDSSVLKKEYEDSANIIQTKDFVEEFSAHIETYLYNVNSIKLTPDAAYARIRFKLNKELVVGQKYTFSVNVSRSYGVSILNDNTDLADEIIDDSGTKTYYQSQSSPSGTIMVSFEATTTNLYLGIYINASTSDTSVCVINELLLTEYVDQYVKNPKVLSYNAKENISNGEAAYLKSEYLEHGNLWRDESEVTINSGTEKWIYVTHDTLVSWGLVEGEVYSIRAIDCPVYAQLYPGYYNFHTRNLPFRFNSSTSFRFGAYTLDETTTFTRKVNLFKGIETPIEYQPYCPILTQDNTRRIYAQIESDYVYNNQSSLGVSSVETFIQQVIKRICVAYPNYQWYTFYFSFEYGRQYTVETYIYSTSDVSDGFPQYAFGEATGFYGNKILFSINQYTWSLDYKLANKNLSVYGSVSGGSSVNILNFRHLDGQDCDGNYDLFLQYSHPDNKVWFGNKGYYIGYNGSYYNGTSENAYFASKLSVLAKVVSSNTSNYPWHRIMSISETTGNFLDAVGTYYLAGMYFGAPYYIFRVEFRTNNSTGGITGNFRIKIIDTNADPNNLYIGAYSGPISDSDSAIKSYADIFVKVTSYARMYLWRLGASDIVIGTGISYYNSEEKSNGIAGDNVYKYLFMDTSDTSTREDAASYILHGLDAYTHGFYPDDILTPGRIISGSGSRAPLVLMGGTGNYREGLRIVPTNSWSDLLLLGDDADKYKDTSANSWGILNNNGSFYITKNGSNAGSTQLDNTDGTWRANNSPILTSANLTSYISKLYNHFLTISFTKSSVIYKCRVNILSSSNLSISTFSTLYTVCYNAKNIIRNQSGNIYYWTMPAEGVPSTYETSTSQNNIIFRLQLYYDFSGDKILFLYYIQQTNSSNNFSVVNSATVDVTFSDTITTIYGGE